MHAPTALPVDAHAQDGAAVAQALQSPDGGLSQAEAARRLDLHGRNALPEPPRRTLLVQLLAQFHGVLIYLLLGSAAIALALGHPVDALVVMLVVLINAAVGHVQEGRAEQALDAVRRMLTREAAVLRDGHRHIVLAEQLVPGDRILLEAGDRVPADVRLLRARNLRIDESALTGESVPVEKHCEPAAPDAPLGDRRSMAYSGTLVSTGQAHGVVVGTGLATELGRISGLLGRIEPVKTPLLRQMDRFAAGLSAAIVVFSLLSFAFAWQARDYTVPDSFLLAVAIAVAAIPEGLTVIVTITLALGVQRMAARHAIVRQLPAVETLGAVSAICSDKTGTLTRNEMTVVAVATAIADYRVEGVGYRPQGRILAADGAPDDPALPALLRAALLCNDAQLHEREGQWHIDGDPMEAALKVLARKGGLDDARTAADWPRLDEVPFDAAHRHDGGRWLYLKGAPERVLSLCASERTAGGERALDAAHWHARIDALATRGQRVLALAEKALPDSHSHLRSDEAEGGLVLLGLVGLIDPPREDAIAAVRECRQAGIRVLMITGDHARTAAAIGAQVGLERSGHALTGSDIDRLDDQGLRDALAGCDVFARTSPEHKLRLVQALQAEGAVIAMTGDGVNDAPALKRADIGVAMGIEGTEAAKEAAKIVLADDNFASIVAAVREGRTIYDNIRKTIAWTLPTNGGEALVLVTALLLGAALPITPVQILWINMLTAVTLGLTFAFEPAEPDIMLRRPRRIDEPLLSRFLLWRVALVSLLFAVAAFGLYEWALWRELGEAAARTLVVNGIVALEVFYLFSVRFLQRSSLDWRGVLGTRAVWAALAGVVLLQLAFTYLAPMQWLFGTAPLPLLDGLAAIAAGVALLTLLEIEKWLARAMRNA